ncbi:lysoplasmalogenase [Aliikangiella marina]|nr:lysoplasmalogenase [Aliikangiella marina]
MTRQFSMVFIVFAVFFTVSTLYAPYPFSWLAKLVPMAILIFIAVRSSSNGKDYLLVTALVFSALGDFLLDYDREGWFVFGLGAFLIAQIFYIFSFSPLQKKHLGWVGAYVFYGIGMFLLIKTQLGELLIPVVVYMTILLLMGISALTSRRSNIWLIVGGLSFVVSDSLIAIDKFYLSFETSHLFIMMTYYFAQYSLTRGYFTNQ